MARIVFEDGAGLLDLYTIYAARKGQESLVGIRR